jgi:LuxR family maltose regulon positive regulatory protein
MGQAAGNVYFFVSAVANQLIVQRALGSLRLARATCQEALAWVRQRNALTASIGGSLYLNLADLLREHNELPMAVQHAEAGVAHTNQEINPGLFIISHLVQMRIKQAQGEWAQVWTLLGEVSALAAEHPTVIDSTLLPSITAQFQVLEAVAMRQSAPALREALTAAMAWAQGTAWEEGALVGAYRFFDFIYLYEHNRIARAQVFIAWARTTGDRSRLHETLAYLERQRQIAEAGSLPWLRIKVHLLQALAYHVLGDTGSTQIALTQALGLAQPEGYVRVFLDEGEPMRLLILDFRFWIARQRADSQYEHLLAYIDKLLAALDAVQALNDSPSGPAQPSIQNPKSKIQNLIEPLTERELEILRLVNSGLSNNEIADQLIVTVGTVKKHLNNIFGKLGVSSRTQALVCARGLNLL